MIRFLDLSRSGVGVSVPFRLNPHTEVVIRIEGMSMVGEVLLPEHAQRWSRFSKKS